MQPITNGPVPACRGNPTLPLVSLGAKPTCPARPAVPWGVPWRGSAVSLLPGGRAINRIVGQGQRPLGGRIHQAIGWYRSKRVWREAKGAAYAPDSRIAGGQDIHVGIANHHRFLRGYTRLLHQREQPFGVGFFARKAVAAVNAEK